MAALDFPSGATTGTIYTGTNNVVYEYDGVKWIGLASAPLDLTNLSSDIIPSADNVYSLGTPSNQWKDIFVSTGSVYIGNIKLSNNDGQLLVQQVLDAGQETEEPVPDTTGSVTTDRLINSTHTFVLKDDGTVELDGSLFTGGGGGDFSGNYDDLTNKPTIPADIGDLTDTNNLLAIEGLPTVTIPETTGTTYKGLQVSYGMVHSNGSSNELNVSKIVIHKPAITVTTIDPTSNNDNFKVDGLGSSDVLVMFVLFGDTNGPKELSTLTSFAQTIIDNVILDGGVEGDFNSLSEMRSNFYSNYSTIATAAGGLDLDFQFFNNFTPATTGTTTVLEGSGATFEIHDNGDTTYGAGGVTTTGTNYLIGHKVLIPGTSLGGATPDNDCIVTITNIDGGGVLAINVSGTAAGGSFTAYPGTSGTNYDVGTGFTVGGINFNNDGSYQSLNINTYGSNYVVGDLITLPGSDLQNGVSPDNDVLITVTSVSGTQPSGWTVVGDLPRVWPSNNISDGGNDQYDTGNYINSSLDNQIAYASGQIVADGVAAFGTGSSYCFVYSTGTFGLLVTGNNSTFIETSGNSGADSNSTTEAGNLYGPNTAEQTFTNAISYLNLVGDGFAGAEVTFVHTDYGSEVDILIPDDGDGAGVGITRDSNGNGIFNPYREGSWNSSVSPGGTLWNIDGWTDLSDVETRTYDDLYATFGSGGLGNKIVGTECVMYLPDNGKYYTVKFSSWTQGGNGGGFAYTRRELDLSSLEVGIRFVDGTRLKSAEGLGSVKLTSPGSRKIEEAHGYKAVSVTEWNHTNLTGTTSRASQSDNNVWFDVTSTTIDDVMDNPANYGDAYDLEFSLDNSTWLAYSSVYSSTGNERGAGVYPNNPTYNQGDTVYFRYKTGGLPVVWWDKNDLPSGGSNFRGAVIDYHAFTGETTLIGTIHIVDDDGEENITHSEVASGSSDGENDDLWLVQNEGTISYRRIDGEAKTLKVQWTARVFYGSEIYD